ncbi:SgcJ/EcaC family oxidoreductase [Rhodococcus spelaei]|uniref:SgcJ/EcaC family oxidoreductase n=1 Tax=Rhodococcus spelaei TaxID=2546320 RepID=A0A541AZW4_9NOCA|nr:SgcJ/EcaC family oxidoreductase [Rhodococcus spelaei]TQF65611.1 SgcJ/EcaC family oxidoreductase [Rhodococcus spelaei]
MNTTALRLAAATLAALALAGAAACSDPSDEDLDLPTNDDIAALFTEWNDALATGNPETVAALYAPDAVLIPTVSNVVRTDHAGIVDYFTGFLPSRPSAVIEQSTINVLDADNAIDTGTYRFTLHQAQGPETVDARFTFVYQRRDDQWLIVNHHSSEMPEP